MLLSARSKYKRTHQRKEKKWPMLKMIQLSLQFIFKILQPLQGWSLFIQNSPHLLAPVKLLLPDFPLNSLTHFPLVSFPLSASHVIVFPGILSSAIFSQLLFSWGDLTHVHGSTTRYLNVCLQFQLNLWAPRYSRPTLYCQSPLGCLLNNLKSVHPHQSHLPYSNLLPCVPS